MTVASQVQGRHEAYPIDTYKNVGYSVNEAITRAKFCLSDLGTVLICRNARNGDGCVGSTIQMMMHN